MLTNDQIQAKLNSFEQKLQGIIVILERTNAELLNKITSSTLNRTNEELRELIRVNAEEIGRLNEKLSKVLLPEETRFYLEAGEVEAFQSNFNTLKAMMVKLEKLYKNIIAYNANLSS
jgi:hypothetical protein